MIINPNIIVKKKKITSTFTDYNLYSELGKDMYLKIPSIKHNFPSR